MNIATPLGAVIVRLEAPADEEFRLALFAESRPDLALLPPEIRTTLVPMQFRAQTLGYRAQFPTAQNSIVERDDRPVGRIVCDRSAGMLNLVDIALLAAMRNRGVGSAILRALMESARTRGTGMCLRVANGNSAARRFYVRLGFVVTEQTPAEAAMEWRAPIERA